MNPEPRARRIAHFMLRPFKKWCPDANLPRPVAVLIGRLAFRHYRNPDRRCSYPWTPDRLGYCWGYASLWGRSATQVEVEAYCSEGPCEFWMAEFEERRRHER